MGRNRKLLTIDQCVTCPDCEVDVDVDVNFYFCKKVRKRIPDTDDFILPIPEWCPLPDAPKGAA